MRGPGSTENCLADELAPSRTVNGVLTATEGESVQGALQRARFWSTRPRIGSGPEGLVWVLEGRADHRYRAVLLGAGLTGPFADVARALLASAGLTPPPLMLAALTPR
ncbi:MAG: hypothetical protein R2712_03990 [Vicinamibacterales bacterium]